MQMQWWYEVITYIILYSRNVSTTRRLIRISRIKTMHAPDCFRIVQTFLTRPHNPIRDRQPFFGFLRGNYRKISATVSTYIYIYKRSTYVHIHTRRIPILFIYIYIYIYWSKPTTNLTTRASRVIL